MGTPDDIFVNRRHFQVKCWTNSCRQYEYGDKVPDTLPRHTYSIALREGGFLNINDLRIKGWTKFPLYTVVYDKWGAPYQPNDTSYLFDENMRAETAFEEAVLKAAVTPLQEGAVVAHELFESYKAAGFTDAEALTLVQAILIEAMRSGREPGE